jgi:hypothetical protein
MANLPAYQQTAATVTARNAEYTGTPLSDVDGDGSYNSYLGCNRAGSCAPGIGINTGFIDPKVDDWTTLDQAGAARDPQDSQHIGGNGLGGTLPSSGGDQSVNPINAVLGTDFNDTLTFEVAAAQAAPGVGFGPANADPINRTDVTVEIGDRVWGTNTVA